jgi:signal transduction histidine kinase
MHEHLLRRLRGLLLEGDTEGALGLIESAIEDLEISDRVDKGTMARVKERLSDRPERDRELAMQDAKQLVEKAKIFLQTVGKEIAFAEISKPTGAFVKDEKYLFVLDLNGIMLAHGENADFVGLDFNSVKDLEGRNFIREILETANEKGYGTVEYIWFHPLSRRYENKVVYFEKVDSIIICSGIYMG